MCDISCLIEGPIHVPEGPPVVQFLGTDPEVLDRSFIYEIFCRPAVNEGSFLCLLRV